ncbi:hypothetical protein EVA_13259 [gut metagenome]|uniref:Uncharacterized protein n=1 Tax=gut metagenome TaxID=749906 RepID=J9CF72_9ZZZZ
MRSMSTEPFCAPTDIAAPALFFNSIFSGEAATEPLVTL